MYTVEAVRGYSDENFQNIVSVYKSAMPETWHYADMEEYYDGQLHNANAIHILLWKGEMPIGYLLAIPHNEAIREEELRAADSKLIEDPERLYVETMEIVPQFQKSLLGGKLFLMMSKALLDEAGKRGIHKFSQHARVTSGLSRAFQKLHGDMVTQVRRIENWPFYNGEEPTDYIEGTYQKLILHKGIVGGTGEVGGESRRLAGM